MPAPKSTDFYAFFETRPSISLSTEHARSLAAFLTSSVVSAGVTGEPQPLLLLRLRRPRPLEGARLHPGDPAPSLPVARVHRRLEDRRRPQSLHHERRGRGRQVADQHGVPRRPRRGRLGASGGGVQYEVQFEGEDLGETPVVSLEREGGRAANENGSG